MADLFKKRHIQLLTIFLMALCARIAANTLFQGINSPQNPSFPDYVAYVKIAKNLAYEGYFGYDNLPKTRFPPGVPFLIAGVFKVFGVNYFVLRLFYCLMGALACVVLFLSCEQMTSESSLPLTSGIIMAIYPPLIYSSMHFGTEVPMMLLLCCLLYVYLTTNKTSSLISYISMAFILSMLIYIHAAQLIFVMVLIITIIIFDRNIHKIYFVTTTIVTCCLLLSPWTYRNSKLTGQLSTTSTHGGSTLWDGNNPITYNDDRFKGGDTGKLLTMLKEKNELGTVKGYDEFNEIESKINQGNERSYTAASVNYIERNLDKVPNVLMWKLYRGIAPTHDSPNRVVNYSFYFTYLTINSLAVIGLFNLYSNRRKYRGIPFVSAQLLFFLFVTLVFFGIHRYRVFMNPSEIILGALGYIWLLQKFGFSKPSTASL